MEKRNKTGGTERNDDSAQLILIAGLLVAIAVVGIAVVVGGGFFSQSTTDGGGISSLSAQVSDQIGAAEQVSQQDLSFVNEDSAQYEGRDQIQVCDEMVNSTSLQQRIASQLAEDEVILDIELMGDCGDGFVGNRSWLAGQTQIDNLPSVNVTDRRTTNVNEVCGDSTSGLHGMTGYPDHIGQFTTQLDEVYEPDNVPEDPDPEKMVDALENAPDIDLTALPNAIDPVDYVNECINVEIVKNRDPADIVFAIDTTGSMDSSNRVTGSWQTSPHSDYPRALLTDTHRPETGVRIPNEWVDVRCATNEPCVWSGGSSGEIVYDNDAGRFAEITSDSPSGQVCTNYHWYYGYCTNYEDTWEVEYIDGSTEDVVVTDLYKADYRLDAPERMWYTQQGLKIAVDDLDRNEPDRAGLMGYDTDQDEKAGVVGIDADSHRQTLKVETDRFFPNGGTDIAEALEGAKSILEDDYGNGPDASTEATKNIVLMTDGVHNPGDNPYSPCGRAEAYECSIEGNQDQYEDIYIHVVILGSDAADDVEAVSDMAKITNDNDPDLSNSDVSESQLPDRDDPRNNGTLIASDDPADAEDIFDNIVGSIEDETEFNNTESNITDPGNDVTGTITANSGVVEEIYDFRMNITDFTSNGTYRVNFADTDASGNEEIVWRMEVDNKMADNDAGTTGYEVKFSSETDNSLNATLQKNFEGNLSDDVSPDEYVWFDLTGKDDDRPRLKMGPGGPESPGDYDMEAAWQEIRDEMDSGGVAIQTTEINPFGQVNGTFSLDFKPLNGNFSRINNIVSGGDFVDKCPSDGSGDMITCGYLDNDRGAVSTAQIRDARVLVTVEGPGGITKREIRIDDFVDIYDEQI